MKGSAQRIILTGFMGAGKTTVAAALARRLNCEMIDLDWLVEEREKREIATFIREDGIEAFRAGETFTLRLVLEGKIARVIALGGGAWMLERNRALIAEHHCFTVWLNTPFELCWERISSEEKLRPLALDRQSAHRLYRERYPLYELAGFELRVAAEDSADDSAQAIIDALRQRRFLKD